MLSPTPKVSLRYGAPLGRASDNLSALQILPTDSPMTLRRVAINSQGYDNGGAYWGIGQPLYWWSIEIREGDSVDECSGYFRATSRPAAREKIRALQPHVRFYR